VKRICLAVTGPKRRWWAGQLVGLGRMTYWLTERKTEHRQHLSDGINWMMNHVLPEDTRTYHRHGLIYPVTSRTSFGQNTRRATISTPFWVHPTKSRMFCGRKHKETLSAFIAGYICFKLNVYQNLVQS
jgi:hypothetical protein